MKKIAFCGKKGSGKTAAATKALWYANGQACKMSLARPLKEIAAAWQGLSKFDHASKEQSMYPWASGRAFLQEIGSLVLSHDQYAFCRILATRMKRFCSDCDMIVIDDVRYPHEVDFLRRYGFYIIKLEGGEEGDSHISETSVGAIVADAVWKREEVDINLEKLFASCSDS